MIGLVADHLALPFATAVRPGEGYRVIETPTYRGFHDGNLIVLDEPPTDDALPGWIARFQDEIGRHEGVRHLQVQWETGWRDDAVAIAAALAAATGRLGLRAEYHEILELGELLRPTPFAEVTTRAVSADEWAHVVDLNGGFGVDIPREFWEWRAVEYRRSVEAGRGAWYLAWDGHVPVASAGHFVGDGLGTVQDVVTHPEHRGRGVAGAMLYAMLDGAPRARHTIIVDPATTAAALYRRLGFAPEGHLWVVRHAET